MNTLIFLNIIVKLWSTVAILTWNCINVRLDSNIAIKWRADLFLGTHLMQLSSWLSF